jgi:hypothetical protein
MTRAEPPDQRTSPGARPQSHTEGPRPDSEPATHLVLATGPAPTARRCCTTGATSPRGWGRPARGARRPSGYNPIDPDSGDREQQAPEDPRGRATRRGAALADLPGSWT